MKFKEIEVISFDVDGTLVKEGFNDLIWRGEIPLLYAQRKNISFEEAKKVVQEEYSRVGEKNPNWYDINFWIKHFQLNVSWKEIISKYEARIELYPDVIPVLERLRKKYRLIVISMMPKEFLTPKLRKIGSYFEYAFSILSELKDLKSPQGYLRICERVKVSPSHLLHVGDSWEFDYVSPRKVNINAVLIDRRNERKGKGIIKDLRELEKII